MRTIKSFKGDFEFLSNFYMRKLTYDKLVWQSSEHAYQAAKTNKYREKLKILDAITPGRAKRLGQKVTIRADWDDVKLQIMEDILKEKFDIYKDNFMFNLLQSTYEYVLVEGNNWHDNFWGDCICNKCTNIKGQNHLGKILMRIRGI